MLARVAENLFWLSRYLERVESTARLINEHSSLLMDLPSNDDNSLWYPLIAITGVDDHFWKNNTVANEETVTFFMIADEKNPSSIVSAMNGVRYNLRSSRNIMPTKLYEHINNLYLLARSVNSQKIKTTRRREFLNEIEHHALAIAGLTEGSMRHDQGYLFMRLGCQMERADMTSRILDVRSANLLQSNVNSASISFENHQWVSVLKSLSAFQIYLSHVRKPVGGPDVLGYLLKDDKLPRAYHCCLLELDACLSDLQQSDRARQELRRLMEKVDGTDICTLIDDKALLHDFLDGLQLDLAGVGNAISARYFPPAD